MKMLLSFLALNLALWVPKTMASDLDSVNVKESSGHYAYKGVDIAYSVYQPTNGIPKVDILYFHGFGDSQNNHKRLFSSFVRSGARVIAFDLPSHGESGRSWFGLTFWDFSDLGLLSASVYQNATSHSPLSTLILAGWSNGGLLATRILQDESQRNYFPNAKGLILYAPGIAVKMCVGGFACRITNETLTHNPDLQDRDARPGSPFFTPLFATKILLNSIWAKRDSLPYYIRTLIFTADPSEEEYVKTKKIEKWALKVKGSGVRVTGVRCEGARHEMDNEPAIYGGTWVRAISADFVAKINNQSIFESKIGKPCSYFINE